MKFINKKYFKTLTVIIVTVILVKLIISNPPKSHRGRPNKTANISIKVITLVPQNYQIKLDSFGTVKPRTESALVAQVSGQIIAVSDTFREGGFFNKGDVLVTLDDRDYQADLKIAEAGILTAKKVLSEEQAKVKQALEDWQRLGNGKKANALVLREPQLAAAKAQLLSAQAKYERANLSLERTKIVAPYAGRILQKQVDVGQVVSMNSKLAEIFATDHVEIRLPLHNSDLRFINLPEQYSDKISKTNKLNNVILTSDLGTHSTWQGQLIRTEGSIDNNAQQLYVVAQIDDPFKQHLNANNKRTMSLKIGQYLEAKISGKLLHKAMIIPNTSIYQGSYVYTVDKGMLQRRTIVIAWQNDHQALISSGLSFGQKLVLTSLGQVSSGTRVKVLSKNQADTFSKHSKPPSSNKKGDHQ